MVSSLFTILIVCDSFPNISKVTQMKIICKIYDRGKSTYQPTTSELTKGISVLSFFAMVGISLFIDTIDVHYIKCIV